ncbi:putative heavy metal-binding protein [Bifidobacterium leontopitheci]|uniref:UPF0145 protein F7D09_1816 n=1 Tax=Bifidobacterium leontopitheci TaxID=2650774 RepID=A0A6I1GG65_9BIFI|nr:putative heavy metal-binding protein [Bifidobacterium leontopitheci]KAB7789682.1 putative heavy-metal-binding [Bifidobacterium leontopitheci]
MILVTTTPTVEGYAITNYLGIVFGEVISGVNMFKDIGAGFRNMFGGRSQGYEEELMKARNEAILEMQQRAEAMGAHAVVSTDVDYEVLGADNGMLMVTVSGTAVQIARRG